MVAIGFVLLCISFVASVLDDNYFLPCDKYMDYIIGISGLVGLVLITAGIATFLWGVMP